MNVPVPEPGKELRPSELVKTKEMMAQTWDAIRAWLAANPNQVDRQSAAMHQGRFMTTALHMVCKLMNPPVDIIEALIECAPETVTWADSNGWLPLHHACANGASGKVLAVLVEAYPEGKVKQDKRFRTPLHFAFFRKDIHEDGIARLEGAERDDDDVGNSIQEIVELLSDSGACELKDEGGMVSPFNTHIGYALFAFHILIKSSCIKPLGLLLNMKASDALCKCVWNNYGCFGNIVRSLSRWSCRKRKQRSKCVASRYGQCTSINFCNSDRVPLRK